ncbi:McrC family protein [Paenibacillus agilis]|uniref:Restriction endonuclease n=1 Tax=Paenibacillus agilis TaxID=3020863 RepID=A0A559J063_9BACL|nr:hypothetical protein [Paenibacillus agilis]TVX93268.1 hypothetical protein FPZ44_09490 [Paenibacillus agilis]
MSKVVVVREAYDWLEARPSSSFMEEDLKELLVYMTSIYPKLEWLELGYNRVKFINIVGSIRLSRVQIDIVPKLQIGEDEGRSALLNMLGVCGYIPYKMGSAAAAVQVVAEDLLSWTAAAFCMELEKQLKRGLATGYAELEENSQRLKGRLMVTKHLQYNAADKSRAYCSFNERTHAIPLNFVFYKTLVILKRKVLDPSIRKKLLHLFGCFEELDVPGNVKELLNQVHFDRQTSRFEPAFRLAKLMLSHMSVLHRGAKEECFSFLFEVHSLYEMYVGRVLQQMTLGREAVIRLQHKEVKLLRNEDSGLDNIQLIPDIVLGERQVNGEYVWTLIMDTKWKDINKYQQGDIYQMYAYVTGYPYARRAVLLYPAMDGAASGRNWTLAANSSKRICVRMVRITHWLETQEDLRGIIAESGWEEK